jgi:sterol 14-demethylase
MFHDLEQGTDALAYVNPYLPLPSFRRRDRARAKLVAYIENIFTKWDREGGDRANLFSILRRIENKDGSPRYSADQITGMFISMMFAGHHTTSTASSWAIIDLLRHPEWMTRVVEELDELYADGHDVSYQALREIPQLECVFKETLRMHAPLILLMRKVMTPFHYKDWVVPVGRIVGVSTAVSNLTAENFPDPLRFDPARYGPERQEDKQSFAWIPFGGGRHRCVGAAFAMMQLKAIFSVLLRRFEFEMAQPSESYRNDHSKMVVQLEQPCRVRYRRRVARITSAGAATRAAGRSVAPAGVARVCLDVDLCQGHAVCVSEAPDVFELDKRESRVRILRTDVTPEIRAKVEAAVRYCPTRALSLEED